MKEFIKRNFAVLLAFALPLVVILVVAISSYIPSLFVSTHYNFIYVTCENTNNYYYNDCATYFSKRFSVLNGKLVVHDVPVGEDTKNLDTNKNGLLDAGDQYGLRIFMHDTKSNESREIALSEAQNLSLSELITSPDGVTVSGEYRNNGGGGFFFFDGYSSSYGYYLAKGKGHARLHLINDNGNRYYYSSSNFHFIGWVLPGRN